jgi:hypothetical protein
MRQPFNRYLVLMLLLTLGTIGDFSANASNKTSLSARSFALYRRMFVLTIAENLGPLGGEYELWKCAPVCLVTIGKAGGKPLSVELVKSTGRTEWDKSLISRLSKISFQPLPRDFKRRSLVFKFSPELASWAK